MKYKHAAKTAFATGMIGLGVFGLINGDFAQEWTFAPAWIPAHQAMAYASATIILLCGLALLVKRTEVMAARILLAFFALLVLLLKIPVIVKNPLVEVAYQSMSELLVLISAAWVLAATDGRPTRAAQILFGLALIPLGLAHFFYLNMTAPLIPAWIPFHTGLAYFTGAAQIAAGIGVVLAIYGKLAASLEASMLTAFTILVWIPLLIATPSSRPTWSEITMSWAVAAGAWVVAASIARSTRDALPTRAHA